MSDQTLRGFLVLAMWAVVAVSMMLRFDVSIFDAIFVALFIGMSVDDLIKYRSLYGYPD